MPETIYVSYGKAKGFGRVAFEEVETDFPIRLYQNKNKTGSFAVQYGKQLKHGLNYEQACTELGASFLHALSCSGKVDNERD